MRLYFKEKSKNIIILITLSIVILLFLIQRLIFFVYYPLPELGRDTFNYFRPSYDIFRGHYPIFNIRTPGYSAFIFFFKLLGSNNLILIGQSIFTLFSFLLSVGIIYKYVKTLFWPFFFALSIWIVSPHVLYYDTAFVSENLYTSLLLLTISFFVCGIFSRRDLIWGLVSLLTGLLCLTRPQGIFIIPFIIGFLIMYRKSVTKSLLLWSILPLSVILSLFMLYNYLTFGRFTLSDLTFLNNLGPTVTYIETDKSYKKEINKAIENLQKKVGLDDRKKLRKTFFDPSLFSESFSKWDTCFTLVDEVNIIVNNDPGNFYRPESIKQFAPIINKIAIDSKLKNPDLYAKFILNSALIYHLNLSKNVNFYFNILQNRSFWLCNDIEMDITNPSKDFKQYTLGKWININNNKPKYVNHLLSTNFYEQIPNEPVIVKFCHYFEIVYNYLFRNLFWIILTFLSILFSIILLIKNCKIGLYSTILVLGLILIVSSIFVSLFQFTLLRLSYPTDFLYYLISFIFLYSIVLKVKKLLQNGQ